MMLDAQELLISEPVSYTHLDVYKRQEEAELMMKHDTPQWYVDSCRKIKYMFPRAHAVAYVTMAYRIAWFKVYYPWAFYAAHLTTKIDDFNWNVVKEGISGILSRIDELAAKGKNAVSYTHLDVYKRQCASCQKCCEHSRVEYKSSEKRYRTQNKNDIKGK